LISTAALGACSTTLHGELVAYDDPKQRFPVVPQKWLSFWLGEIVQENGYTVAKSLQSFSFLNAKTTFPVPFALNIDSPKECPNELNLHVTGSDRLGFHYEFPLNGGRRVNLERFERIRVGRPSFCMHDNLQTLPRSLMRAACRCANLIMPPNAAGAAAASTGYPGAHSTSFQYESFRTTLPARKL